MFGLIIFTSGQLFRMAIKSKALVILGAAFILLSYPLLLASTFAWSELLFTFLAILFIIFLPKFLYQRRFIVLFFLSILAALCCLQKYIGITVIFTGFTFLAFMPKASFTQKLKYVIAFGCISATPLVIWLIRNYTLTSTFTEDKGPSQYSLLQNISQTLHILTIGLIPYIVSSVWSRIIIIISGVVFLVVMAQMVIAPLSRYNLNKRTLVEAPQIFCVGVFVVAYTLFLVISASIVAINPIYNRLLIPIYVFIIFLVFLLLDKAIQPVEIIICHSSRQYRLISFSVVMIMSGVLANKFLLALDSSGGILGLTTISNIRTFQVILIMAGIVLLTQRQIARICTVQAGRLRVSARFANSLNRLIRQKAGKNFVVIGLCTIWLMLPLVGISKKISVWTQKGVGGCNTVVWRESSLIKFLQVHPLEGKIYSNKPHAVYMLNNAMSARWSPRKHLYASPSSHTDDITKLQKLLSSNSNIYLVWFDTGGLDWLYSFQELDSIFDMKIVTTCSDGAVYLVKSNLHKYHT